MVIKIENKFYSICFIKILFFLSVFFFNFPLKARCEEVNGIVTDVKGKPLPFANVYIKGTTIGTTTNMEGHYYLELKKGIYQIIFQYIGYKTHTETIEIKDKSLTLDIKLKLEQITLPEFVVSANAEDPAYPIIRNAINKRKYYLTLVNGFSCNVYIKGIQRITKAPEKIMGIDIDIEEILDSNNTGIVYLSESESKLFFAQPKKIKEEMYSSKVSGDNKAFSWNQASEMLFNFYENIIEVEGLSDRGFVSPISQNALFYYKYKLIGTFKEDGETVNMIQVIPKRKSDPVFSGYIYITENSWRIHSIDLMLSKESQIDFVDSLRINQMFVTVDDSFRMPFSQRFDFNFKVLSIEGNGNFVGIFKNYLINPDFPKKFFDNEMLNIKENANNKDSSYWEESRPIPLTIEEAQDYSRKDSIMAIRQTKAYQDSIDKKNNKLKISDLLLFGYSYNKSHLKDELGFSSILKSIQFNPAEGLNFGLHTYYRKSFESMNGYRVEHSFKYGFSNKHFNAKVQWFNEYKPQKFGLFYVSLGRYTFQFNDNNPILPTINTLYALFNEQSLMKIYEKNYLKFLHQQELYNGIKVRTSLEFADRFPLSNITEYTWINKENRSYSVNNPQNLSNNNTSFKHHQALLLTVALNLRIRQQYFTRPNEKIILGSDYPEFRIKYNKGINKVLGSDVNFDHIEIGLGDDIKLGLAGSSNFDIFAGKFLNDKQITFIDYKHFQGNKTFISNQTFAPVSFFEQSRTAINSFQMLDYYDYSTTGWYLDVHYEHHFYNFIFNKIPLVRKAKLETVAGTNILYTQHNNEYLEAFVGIENIAKIFRIDFITAYNRKDKIGNKIVITINLNL